MTAKVFSVKMFVIEGLILEIALMKKNNINKKIALI